MADRDAVISKAVAAIVKELQTVYTATMEPEWISVESELPAETHSIFWPWKDTAKWNNAMWAEQSDKVIVAIRFKDGTRIVRTGETHDGKWHTDISKTLEPVVTHWMPFPELPKEEINASQD